MFGRFGGRAVRRSLALVCVCGMAGGVSAAPGSSPDAAAVNAPREVPLNGRTVKLRIENENAKTSAAIETRTGKGGVAMPDRAVRLTSRVIVKTSDLDGLRTRVNALGRARPDAAAGVAAFDGAPGYAVIDAASVGEAVSIASSLRATGRYGSVEVAGGAEPVLRGPNEPNLANGTIWHLRNLSNPIADINADAAWDMGYTGAGVTVSVVEGGYQDSHPDLLANNDAGASQTVGQSSHGTGVAGIAAAVGDNGMGAVGLAYNASLTEMNGASFDPGINALSFTFMNSVNDIKNNSWGPSDNGALHSWSAVERDAIIDSVTNGRGGLGTIVCWAAGNGGTSDRVDYDPYASSRYTFAIGSVGDNDTEAWYNELGSSMLVVTHSSGNVRGTFTTNTGDAYNNNFGGTSSASPLAMGAIALALEANPAMSWRDMMHALVETARKCDAGDSSWTTNAAGQDISYKFGFGAIDAGALCAAAETWTPVADEVSATSGVVAVNTAIPDNDPTGLTRTAAITEDITIESFELVMNLTHTYVGDLEIIVTSPQGTESIVSARRGDTTEDMVDYVFTSLRSWGESSQGTWTVELADLANQDVGVWGDFAINVYGTTPSAACSFADCDANGAINLDDLDCFVAGFLAADLAAADCDGNGAVNLDDIDCFVAAFLAGCPSGD
ncbi:MAG: S8 family serine peptidase [Phycisphaerales bacterium]